MLCVSDAVCDAVCGSALLPAVHAKECKARVSVDWLSAMGMEVGQRTLKKGKVGKLSVINPFSSFFSAVFNTGDGREQPHINSKVL